MRSVHISTNRHMHTHTHCSSGCSSLVSLSYLTELGKSLSIFFFSPLSPSGWLWVEYRCQPSVSDVNCPPLAFPRVLLEWAIKRSSQADAPWAAIICVHTHTQQHTETKIQSWTKLSMTLVENNGVDISDSQIAACQCVGAERSGTKLYYQLLLLSYRDATVKGPNPAVE